MGWLRGFEPPASGTTNQRSNQLSYSHHKKIIKNIYFFLKITLFKYHYLKNLHIYFFIIYSAHGWS